MGIARLLHGGISGSPGLMTWENGLHRRVPPSGPAARSGRGSVGQQTLCGFEAPESTHGTLRFRGEMAGLFHQLTR
jgi:hypothetical protein